LENGRISDLQGLMTLTMTLDRVILHTVVRHSSTSTYILHFVEIKETFWDRRMDGHLRPTLLGRLGDVDLKNENTKTSLLRHNKRPSTTSTF